MTRVAWQSYWMLSAHTFNYSLKPGFTSFKGILHSKIYNWTWAGSNKTLELEDAILTISGLFDGVLKLANNCSYKISIVSEMSLCRPHNCSA